MIIDFKNIEKSVLPNFKGGEGAMIANMHTDGAGKILLGRLEPGSTIGYHKHENNSEYIYLLSGCAEFIYDDTTETTVAGGCHFCPEGHSHSMMNNSNEDLVFFAVVPELGD